MKVNVVSALSRLAGGLESHILPTTSEVATTFLLHENISIYIPSLIHDKQLKDSLPHMVELRLKNHPESSNCTLIVQFIYLDGDIIRIKLDDILSDNPAKAILNPDMVPDKYSVLTKKEQIDARSYPISRQDLAIMIASILKPSPSREYENATEFNYLDKQEYYVLTETLKTKATEHETSKSYDTANLRTSITLIRYRERNGEMVYAQMYARMNGGGRVCRVTMDQSKKELVRLDEMDGVGSRKIDFETPVNGAPQGSDEAEYGPGYDDLHRLVGFANNLYGKVRPPIERLLGSAATNVDHDDGI